MALFLESGRLVDFTRSHHRYPNVYGIRALESCRARHYNLFRQSQRHTVRVGRRGEADDLGSGGPGAGRS